MWQVSTTKKFELLLLGSRTQDPPSPSGRWGWGWRTRWGRKRSESDETWPENLDQVASGRGWKREQNLSDGELRQALKIGCAAVRKKTCMSQKSSPRTNHKPVMALWSNSLDTVNMHFGVGQTRLDLSVLSLLPKVNKVQTHKPILSWLAPKCMFTVTMILKCKAIE